MVLRHLVSFKFTEDAPVDEIVSRFRGLKAQIPELLSLEAGPNTSKEGFSKDLTHIFLGTFKDAETLQIYLDSAPHQAFVEFSKEFFADVCVVDFTDPNSAPAAAPTAFPRRVFKLGSAADLKMFREIGKVRATLDTQDGFVHLCDARAVREVVDNFFGDCEELCLMELDAWKFESPVWVTGDDAPDLATISLPQTTVHYNSDLGCVHVYGGLTAAGAVDSNAIVRDAQVPKGEDGSRCYPAWLDESC
eukprot:TRINITY_DN4085_c0_g1_i9.p1 TRINITY_DN4085_c0_g1~~TRINITY_DN4085_c0_g1_i9.p1  ORF type:complete len:248 (+),score=53.50 TRINITY_DN4085_c0_g1_i9:203-946(+)